MRILASSIFALALLLFVSHQANAQMFEPGETGSQKIGTNCVVYHLRKDKISNDSDIGLQCQSKKGWPATSHDVPFIVLPMMSALYNAERAYCGSPGCSAPNKDIRLVLIGDPLPNLSITSSKAKAGEDTDSVTILITTTLIDFVLRTGHLVLNDLLEDAELAPQGFNAFLNNQRSLGGKSCSLPVQWNNLSVSKKINEDTIFRIAMTSFQILFAHEFAHLLSNQTCGYKKDPKLSSDANTLGLEKACDHMAFTVLAKQNMAMPLFFTAALVAWENYIILKRPQLIKDFPGGELKFREAFPSLQFRERAASSVSEWEQSCKQNPNVPMCNVWQDGVRYARKLIASAPPAACVP